MSPPTRSCSPRPNMRGRCRGASRVCWTGRSAEAGSIGSRSDGSTSSHGASKDTYAALRIVLERAGAKIVESACADVPVPREAVCPNGRIAALEIRAVMGRVTSERLEATKIKLEQTAARQPGNMTRAHEGSTVHQLRPEPHGEQRERIGRISAPFIGNNSV